MVSGTRFRGLDFGPARYRLENFCQSFLVRREEINPIDLFKEFMSRLAIFEPRRYHENLMGREFLKDFQSLSNFLLDESLFVYRS